MSVLSAQQQGGAVLPYYIAINDGGISSGDARTISVPGLTLFPYDPGRTSPYVKTMTAASMFVTAAYAYPWRLVPETGFATHAVCLLNATVLGAPLKALADAVEDADSVVGPVKYLDPDLIDDAVWERSLVARLFWPKGAARGDSANAEAALDQIISHYEAGRFAAGPPDLTIVPRIESFDDRQS